MESQATRKRVAGGLAVILLGLAVPLAAAEAPAGVAPEALAKLKQMTDYVGGLKQFSLRGQATLEVVLTSGQKLQFDHDVQLLVQRPSGLLATRKGELADQALYVDGESLVFSTRGIAGNYYATAKVPANLDGALDYAREELDLVMPAADLLYTDAYASLTSDMTSGFVVTAKALLNGASCTHLAFRKPGVDVQVWVANGAEPLPLKLVLTTTDMAGSPQFVISLSDWNTNPRVEAGTFRFTPSAEAKHVDFVPPAGATSPIK